MILTRWTMAALLGLSATATSAEAQRRTSSPTYEQIGALIQDGLDSLGRGDTAAYLRGTAQAFALAPRVPPVAYHHARAHALAGSMDTALTLLERLAIEGAVVVDEAETDSAFAGLRASRGWKEVATRIAAARRPISTSAKAFELPERDLTAEGTAWDSKTRTLFLSSLYKRKIVAIGPDGRVRDFIAPGQDGIGPVVGIEVDPGRRGLWAASMVLREAGIPLSDTSLLAHGLLYHYDVDTGHLRRRYLLPPAKGRRHGFNDVTVMPDGDVYITDSQSGGIYLVKAGADDVAEVLPPGTYTFPNGITRTDDGKRLFVAHGAGVDRIDIASGRRIRLGSPDTLNLGAIDGLAFHRNTLIAHQPGWFNRLVRLRLDSAHERVASWEVLERHHPRFEQPTTGEVAGDTYYYIANAQLRRFRDDKILPWDSLSPVLVLKTELSQGRSDAGAVLRDAIGSGAAPGAAGAVGRGGNEDGVRHGIVHHRGPGAGAGERRGVRGPGAAKRARAGRHGHDRPERSPATITGSCGLLRASRQRAVRTGAAVRSEPQAPRRRLSLHGGRPGAVRDGVARARVALATGEATDVHTGGARRRDTDAAHARLPGAGGRRAQAAAPTGWRARHRELLAIYPEERLVVAVLANATGAPLQAAVRQLARGFLTPGEPARPHPRASAAAPAPPPGR